ncbi:unnamed protein product, partial [marine sediment metagenome]
NGKGNGKARGLSIFDEARKIYPGTRLGLQTEFDNFVQKHKDWQEILPLLKPAVECQIADRKRKKAANEFVPAWKNFKTWINNRCWEEEPTTIPTDTKSAPSPQAAVCIIDRKPARDYRKNGRGEPIWLCVDCCRAIGDVDWGKMSKPEIERAVEDGKRRPLLFFAFRYFFDDFFHFIYCFTHFSPAFIDMSLNKPIRSFATCSFCCRFRFPYTTKTQTAFL